MPKRMHPRKVARTFCFLTVRDAGPRAAARTLNGFPNLYLNREAHSAEP
jgi:hypothetical protein